MSDSKSDMFVRLLAQAANCEAQSLKFDVVPGPLQDIRGFNSLQDNVQGLLQVVTKWNALAIVDVVESWLLQPPADAPPPWIASDTSRHDRIDYVLLDWLVLADGLKLERLVSKLARERDAILLVKIVSAHAVIVSANAADCMQLAHAGTATTPIYNLSCILTVCFHRLAS